MAKAALRKAEMEPLKVLGRCVDRVRLHHGLTLEEFAHELGKEPRQVSRWFSGDERPQIDVVFAITRFRAPLVIALAELSQEIEIETVIRVRRSA